MKNLIFIICVLSAGLFYSSCGNSTAKKEKARQESIKKAEEEAKQKAEQDKKQAWQDLLNACKDEDNKDKLIGTYYLTNELDKKDPLRMLIKEGHIKDNLEAYATLGKRKVDSGYLLCVSELFNGTKYGDTKMYDRYTWMFSTDEQGNILDKIKIDQSNLSLKEDSPISIHESHYLEKISKASDKEVTFAIVKGRQEPKSNLFKGEKIQYKLENGKFKETGRKKEQRTIEGRE